MIRHSFEVNTGKKTAQQNPFGFSKLIQVLRQTEMMMAGEKCLNRIVLLYYTRSSEKFRVWGLGR